MTHTKKKIIGITGGIASGKSTFSNILRQRGYKLIDADEIAKDLMKKDGPSFKKTVDFFGKEILKEDGQIDRSALGRIVFSDEKLLKELNNLSHPDIFIEIKKEIERSSEEIIFLDIPLLFEEYESILKYGISFDGIWLIYADRQSQIKRLMKRDALNKEEAIKRIDAQLSMDFKKKKATRVIFNLGSIDKLEEEVDLLLKDLS